MPASIPKLELWETAGCCSNGARSYLWKDISKQNTQTNWKWQTFPGGTVNNVGRWMSFFNIWAVPELTVLGIQRLALMTNINWHPILVWQYLELLTFWSLIPCNVMCALALCPVHLCSVAANFRCRFTKQHSMYVFGKLTGKLKSKTSDIFLLRSMQQLWWKHKDTGLNKVRLRLKLLLHCMRT